MASKNSELWRQARRARDTLVERLADHPEVSLIDIGYDPGPEADQDPDRVVVRVHVRRPPADLGLDLPQEVEGIQVRVVPGDYQPEAAPPRPAPGEEPPSQVEAPSRERRRKPSASGSRKRAAGREAGGGQGLADFAVSLGLAPENDGEPRLEINVRHLQSGESMHWQGVPLEQLNAWMLSRANLPPSASAAPQPVEQARTLAPEPGGTAVVELSGLWVSQVKAPYQPGRPRGANMLRAEVCFSVVEPTPAILSAGQVPYTIEFLLLNLETNECISAALFEGLLRPGEMDCPIEQDLAIPPLGRYQLDLVARLLPPGIGMDRLIGPTIIVEK